jgi:hypothetical protein
MSLILKLGWYDTNDKPRTCKIAVYLLTECVYLRKGAICLVD